MLASTEASKRGSAIIPQRWEVNIYKQKCNLCRLPQVYSSGLNCSIHSAFFTFLLIYLPPPLRRSPIQLWHQAQNLGSCDSLYHSSLCPGKPTNKIVNLCVPYSYPPQQLLTQHTQNTLVEEGHYNHSKHSYLK